MSQTATLQKSASHSKWLIVELMVLSSLYTFLNYIQLIYPNDYILYNSFNLRDNSLYWALLNRTVWNGIIFFPLVYWLIPKFLTQAKWLYFTIALILIVTVSSLGQYLTEMAMEAIYNLPENLDQLFPDNELTSNAYGPRQVNIRTIAIPILGLNTFIVFVALIYSFSRDWWRNVQIQRQLKEEKLRAELNFLRSQINPHFLFNTLNNIFSVARKNKDHETAELIAKLSDTMRYMLTEIDADFIDINEEIECIENIIEIIKLRYSEDEVSVEFEIADDIQDLQIAPLLLVPFVENAFKYGVRINKQSTIDIKLFRENNKLIFMISNKIYNDTDSIEAKNGIGLGNVKKRLDLLYADRYNLDIKQTDDYSVRLELKVT